ncbi:MAG: cell envelope-related transcriptional attenuator [uncultured bacterium]|uniref:Cell envelope-related transcriptional attenuator n=1 Tax=Candidatus Daviesbacteria bacterium GW2011_GWC2_40_12 TaxID=1618431 RepID=A0A0G0TVV5_9BACT|nr:MAG: cell envelope-related transcriptional attenuator [uncultured bacterium]KKQ84965.1 MAG: Cell envelope-related transcriptional attenuator [Candidatus Daviesbacteria bacterium GW2011_GWF2_38_7]KKR16998.1 MAG: Cell envelope-related transcriptional attenuator [Candidatus Daviesbacteria bacterium GW2011_GWA2_39_33]KKR42062.1 MAG: Cell envelope-related transcriptional attenuator [Candidatus Daviesbacteria bacterium GW2011_GWC2_40_12]
MKNTTRKLIPLLVIIGILISIAFFLTTLSGTSSYVSHIISGTSLKSGEGRINILLLGIAGGSHGGASLTDTIMVASYNLKTSQIDLISLPRDLWLPSLQSKANAVYQKGLVQGNGLGLSKVVIGNILGIPIHYALLVDFRGFVAAIDALGGIDVQVEKSFDDYQYPIEGKENDMCGLEEKEMDFNENDAKNLNIEPGKRLVLILQDGKIATDAAQEDRGVKYFNCRYEHIKFEKGQMHMSGAVALSFVRSRHGTNGEGSDFARSKRQQKVIEAVKSKILSLETLTSPQKVGDLISVLGKSIDTDVKVKDTLESYKLLRKIEQVHTFVLDDSLRSGLPDGRKTLFVNPPRSSYGGAYVLVSQDDDFSIVQEYVRKILRGEITEYEATSAARPR